MTAGKKSSNRTVNESKKIILMEQYIYMHFLSSCKNICSTHSEKSDDALAIDTKLQSPSQPTWMVIPLDPRLSEG